jgi:hypothetical protein
MASGYFAIKTLFFICLHFGFFPSPLPPLCALHAGGHKGCVFLFTYVYGGQAYLLKNCTTLFSVVEKPWFTTVLCLQQEGSDWGYCDLLDGKFTTGVAVVSHPMVVTEYDNIFWMAANLNVAAIMKMAQKLKNRSVSCMSELVQRLHIQTACFEFDDCSSCHSETSVHKQRMDGRWMGCWPLVTLKIGQSHAWLNLSKSFI